MAGLVTHLKIKQIDEVVEAAMAENKPTIVNVYVDENAAPLPGKL